MTATPTTPEPTMGLRLYVVQGTQCNFGALEVSPQTRRLSSLAISIGSWGVERKVFETIVRHSKNDSDHLAPEHFAGCNPIS